MRELTNTEMTLVSGGLELMSNTKKMDCRTVCTPVPGTDYMDCVRECRPVGGWGFGN
jgi:hypothetical protein